MRTYTKQQINRLIALETLLGGGSSGPILSIGVTAPITTTGGDTPTIGITPATDIAAGSMSAADKQKLDNLPGRAGTMHLTNFAASPYQAVAATYNVIVDVQTGNGGNANVVIHPPLNPTDGAPFSVKVNLGDSSAAPVLIEPVAGQPAIEDPSQPGTFRTNVATFAAIKSGPGGYAAWFYNATLNQWLLDGVI